MELTFKAAQQQVDERIGKHPDGYFDNKKMFEKFDEEKKETEEALKLYLASPTVENAKALKTEIGDVLFAVICLANKHNIDLAECFDLMIEKNKNRAKNNYIK